MIPGLGVGIIYAAGLDEVVGAGLRAGVLDVVEVEPETLWATASGARREYRVNHQALSRIDAIDLPKLVHGVGFPVGGTAPLDVEHLRRFVEVVERLRSPWVSEHLSFSRTVDRANAGWYATGFLLPPIQSPEGVALAASNIRRLQAHLPVPFAFETGVNYLRPQPRELSDGAFFGAVADAADCGLLVDLHNLWTNERNGRQTVLDAMAEIPAERVWEMHLAGGEQFGTHWLDAHSDLVPEPLMQLAAEVIPRLPNLGALNFEIMPDYIRAKGLTTDQLVAQLLAMQSLWALRQVRVRANRPPVAAAPTNGDLPSPAEWEQLLGGMVVGAVTAAADDGLAADPGIDVLRRLVEASRAGTVVDCLPLTSRLLMLELGNEGYWQLLQDFWSTTRPEPFGVDEARNLGSFLRSRELDAPHVGEVLSFELASLAVFLEGKPLTVEFSCEPMPLLSALGEGRRPEGGRPGRYELVIEP